MRDPERQRGKMKSKKISKQSATIVGYVSWHLEGLEHNEWNKTHTVITSNILEMKKWS